MRAELGFYRKVFHRVLMSIGIGIGAISVMTSIRELMRAYIKVQ